MDGDTKPDNHIDLYVKAGADGERYGACIQCQRVFMVMLLKAQTEQLQFTVTTINQARPPESFKKMAHRLPTVTHQHRVMEDPEEICQYMDVNFPEVDLTWNNVEAERACQDVFSKFSFYVKEIAKDPSHLLAELRKLNAYLERAGSTYLCGPKPSHLDCQLLAKLQHVRVAGAALKAFQIPRELAALWHYLGAAYHTDVFRKACPSDQEIVIHWASRQDTPNINHAKEKALLSEDSRYSFDVPV